MAAHERWRIYITATLGEWFCQIPECELRGTVGGADLTGSGTPFTGTGATGTEIFDNNVTTKATINNAGVYPCWFGYHFGAGNAQHVEEFTITTDGGYDRAPTDFQLQWSDDGSTWTTVRTFTGVTWAADETKTFAGDPTPSMSVTSVSPSAGPVAGGTAITISGSGFAAGATVSVGGSTATDVVVVSATEITAVTPAHALGLVDVAVTVGSTTATLVGGFTYQGVVTSVSPTSLLRVGGVLQVNGVGFVADAVVLVDGAAVSTTYVSSTQLTATIPSGLAVGGHDVAVANGQYGTSASLLNAFLTQVRHRYWRIWDPEALAGLISAYEIEMRESPGGANAVTSEGGAFALSRWSNDYHETNAFDGETDRNKVPPIAPWLSNFATWNVGIWIGYDFGALPRDIQEVAWQPGDYSPGPFIVQWSDDGQRWIDSWIDSGSTGWDDPFDIHTRTPAQVPPPPVASRYWRLVMWGSGYANLSEVELRASVGGPNLCGAGTATASTSEQNAPLVVDGNPATSWSHQGNSDSFPVWWQYDFGAGAAHLIREIKITGGVGTFRIEQSQDGSTWTTVATYADVPGFFQSDLVGETFIVVASDLSVSAVDPGTGPAAGGTPVTLTGTGFIGASGATFGGVAATNVVVVSDTQITCTTPAHAAGVVDVTVTVAADSATLAGGFTYLDPQRIDSVDPSVVHLSGGPVTITGAGFIQGVQVLFGGTPGTVTSVSDTEIAVTAPPKAAPGAVTLTVRWPDASTRSVSFTYEDHAVTSVSPTVLPPSGGSLYVNGRWFVQGATALVDGSPVATTYLSPTQLSATIPAGLALGFHDVSVVNGMRGITPELEAAFLTAASVAAGSTVLFVVT